MEILSWSVRAGGRVSDIGNVLEDLDCDIVALGNVALKNVNPLLEVGCEIGLKYGLSSSPLQTQRGLLTMSKFPLQEGERYKRMKERFLYATCPEMELDIVNIHIPAAIGKTLYEKKPMWEWLLKRADVWKERRVVLVGDFNTGDNALDRYERGYLFACEAEFHSLSSGGWKDAYRACEGDRQAYSWWTKGGFRIDHAFVSPAMLLPKSCHYLTEVHSRRLVKALDKRNLPAISDHAAIHLNWE